MALDCPAPPSSGRGTILAGRTFFLPRACIPAAQSAFHLGVAVFTPPFFTPKALQPIAQGRETLRAHPGNDHVTPRVPVRLRRAGSFLDAAVTQGALSKPRDPGLGYLTPSA